MTQRAIAGVGFCLTLLMTASAGLAQDAKQDINKAEQLMADILIGMAEVELRLNEAKPGPLAASPDGGDVVDRAKDRIALLENTEVPQPKVAAPLDPVDPVKGEEIVAPRVTVTAQPVKPIEPAPPGLNVTAVSLDGQTIRSLLKSDLTEAEKAALPDHTQCKDLGDWFIGLPLQRDHLTFFVREGGFVRICSRLGNAWRVRTAGSQTRAHLVTATN